MTHDNKSIPPATLKPLDNTLDLTYKELKEINDKLHPKKVRVTIAVPLVDNDGNTLEYKTLKQFEQMLLKNVGGFTVITSQGVWIVCIQCILRTTPTPYMFSP